MQWKRILPKFPVRTIGTFFCPGGKDNQNSIYLLKLLFNSDLNRSIKILNNIFSEIFFTVIHCPIPKKLLNGFVYSPCPTHYGSQCSFGCDSGYFSELSTFTCNENGFWKPNNYSCSGKLFSNAHFI